MTELRNVTAQIEITGKCQCKCPHCYGSWQASGCHNNDVLGVEELDLIIGKLADANIGAICFTGGEPLLHKGVLFLGLGMAKVKGIPVLLNTNLIEATEEDISGMRRLGVLQVMGSIHGPDAAVHDEISGFPGSFEKLVNNMRLVSKSGIMAIVHMVITPGNLRYLKDTARLAKSMGFFFRATRAGCPSNGNSTFSLAKAEFALLLEQMEDLRKEDIFVMPIDSYPICTAPDGFNTTLYRRCPAGKLFFTVATNGNVRPCPHGGKEFVCGNLLLESVADIWEKMSAWRDGSFLSERCKQCPSVGSCGGGCRMEAYNRTGDIRAMDPYAR